MYIQGPGQLKYLVSGLNTMFSRLQVSAAKHAARITERACAFAECSEGHSWQCKLACQSSDLHQSCLPTAERRVLRSSAVPGTAYEPQLD